MAQETDENGKPLTYWGGLDFTNKNADKIKSNSTQLSGTILASESLGVDNLVNKQQSAVEWLQERYNEGDGYERHLTESEFEQSKQMEQEQSIAFHKWMLQNDTEQNAEKYFQYSDENMWHEFLNSK